MAELEQVIEQTEQLSPQEKLLLVSRLVESLCADYTAAKSRRR